MINELIVGEDDDWGVADRRVKPALLTLLHDQAALIDSEYSRNEIEYDLRSGFPDRRRLIEWYQRAAVRTLGYIADYWEPIDCVDDENLVKAMVSNPIGDIEPHGPWVAADYRRRVESMMVMPACNSAYRNLRSSASEYIRTPDEEGEKSAELDPDKQKHVAMRPGFQTLDDQQRKALERLWGGFDSRDELGDWILSLNSPTNGEIRNDLSQSVTNDDVAMKHLVREPDTDGAIVYREAFACVELLPAFIEGIEAAETAELAKTKSETPTTMRMKRA